MEPESLDELLGIVQSLYRRKGLSRPVRLIVKCEDSAHNLNVPVGLAKSPQAAGTPVIEPVSTPTVVPVTQMTFQPTIREAILAVIETLSRRILDAELVEMVRQQCPQSNWHPNAIARMAYKLKEKKVISHKSRSREDDYGVGYGKWQWNKRFSKKIQLPEGTYIPPQLQTVADRLVLCNNGPTIYFLIKDKVVIYVGSSITPKKRLCEHRYGTRKTAKKDFDSHLLLPVTMDNLLQQERIYVALFDPPSNKNLKNKV